MEEILTNAGAAIATAASQAPAAPAGDLLNSMWVLIAALLVFFMNAGFAFLEAGFVRAKNTVNVLAKNFIVFALSTIAFWLIGYSIMFYGNFSASALGNLKVNGVWDFGKVFGTTSVYEIVFFFFQLAFAGTAATIVSGAVAERIEFISYILFSVILVALIYPLVGLPTWGGGFLSKMGFRDFAGSTVVHSVVGWAALAGIIILGPRKGKFSGKGKDKKINAIPGHSVPLATLGAFILWLGWFGFNPGSELAFDPNVGLIALNTNIAGVTGMIAATILTWIRFRKPDFSMMINGLLAGLVAITAGCAYVSMWGSFFIGLIAGAIVTFGVPMFEKLGLDDPVGATSVHLLNGVAGTLLVGFFATDAGVFYGGGWNLVLSQLAGIGYTGVVVFASSIVLWLIIKATVGMRVGEKEEIEGLDIGEMGSEAYSYADKR